MTFISGIYGKDLGWVKKLDKDIYDELGYIYLLEKSNKAKIQFIQELETSQLDLGNLIMHIKQDIDFSKRIIRILGRRLKRDEIEVEDLGEDSVLKDEKFEERTEFQILEKIKQLLQLLILNLKEQERVFKNLQRGNFSNSRLESKFLKLAREEERILRELIAELKMGFEEAEKITKDIKNPLRKFLTELKAILKLKKINGQNVFNRLIEMEEAESGTINCPTWKGQYKRTLLWPVWCLLHRYRKYWTKFLRNSSFYTAASIVADMWFVHIVVGLILVHKDREALIMTRRGIQLQHLLKGSFLSQPALWMEYAFLTNNLNLFMRANSFNASGYHITLIWDPAKRRYMPETGPAAKIKIEKGKEYAIARDWYLKLVGERRRNDNSFWDKEDAGYYWNQLPEEIRREAIANYHKIRSLFGSE